MPRFLAVVKLSPPALQDLAGPRKRFEQVRRYLARRGIRLDVTFRLDGAYHLFVLEASASPTRLLNRALARAWPEPHERPEHARLIDSGPWPMGADLEGRPEAVAMAVQTGPEPVAVALQTGPEPVAMALQTGPEPVAVAVEAGPEAVAVGAREPGLELAAQPSAAARPASYLASSRARSSLISRSSRPSSSLR